jgi:DNA (cytosine-5)-methyltransferase 1
MLISITFWRVWLALATVKKKNESWLEHASRLKKTDGKAQTQIEYDIYWQLLNAADYGVPQTRERVVIVGIRSDLKLQWHFPNATHSEDRLLWEMFVTKRYWDTHQVAEHPLLDDSMVEQKLSALKAKYGFFEPEGLPWLTIRDALSDVPDPRAIHSINDHIYKAGARSYPGHTGSDLDWPSKTIKAGGHGVPGGENMIRYPNGEVRYLTVFEAKRLQTFPDGFEISGAWGEAMRQIGNAVPVTLGAVLGNKLASILKQTNA